MVECTQSPPQPPDWLPRQSCAVCEVVIRGEKRTCPLCQHRLPPSDRASEPASDLPRDAWPQVPIQERRHLALRILIFISVGLIVVSFVIQRLFPISIRWPLIFLLALASMWMTVASIMRRRRSVARIISSQLGILAALAVIWDWAIGWRGWSLDYAVPFLCIAAMGSLYITALSLHLHARDYLVYLLITAALSLVPLVFLLLDLVTNSIPSLLSVALSILLFTAIVLFHGAAMRAELSRRLHL